MGVRASVWVWVYCVVLFSAVECGGVFVVDVSMRYGSLDKVRCFNGATDDQLKSLCEMGKNDLSRGLTVSQTKLHLDAAALRLRCA